MMKLRISSISKGPARLVEALQRRWRRDASLNELATFDASGLADIGIDGAARDAILGRAVGSPPRPCQG